MIQYIAFVPGVSLSIGTRDITTLNGYSSDKHSKDIDVEETAAWLYFYVKKDGKRTGRRIRVPVSAVASIAETVDVAPKGKAS